MFVLRSGKGGSIATWKDVAVIHTEVVEVAIAESRLAIADWATRGFRADKWVLEGIGARAGITQEVL